MITQQVNLPQLDKSQRSREGMRRVGSLMPHLERGGRRTEGLNGPRPEGGVRNRCGWTEKELSARVQARKKWSPRKLLELGGLGQEVSGLLGEGEIQSQASRGRALGLDRERAQARGRVFSCFLLIGPPGGGPANAWECKEHPIPRMKTELQNNLLFWQKICST